MSEEKSDDTKGQMQREEMSSSANRKVQSKIDHRLGYFEERGNLFYIQGFLKLLWTLICNSES